MTVRLAGWQKAFDGADYHFHMTVAIGGQPWSVYQSMYEDMTPVPINLRYLARSNNVLQGQTKRPIRIERAASISVVAIGFEPTTKGL